VIQHRYADRVRQFSPLRLPDVPPNVISFGSGDAYPGGMPDMLGSARQAFTEFRSEVLQYSAAKGLPELRQWVADYVGSQGTRVTPDHVLIVNGAKHGLDLVCKLFLSPGDSVVVTKPTYMTALPIFRGYEAVFVEIGQDAEGLLTQELEECLRDIGRKGQPLPKLIYNIPEFHNPTGITMSQRRRIELVGIAQRYGILVVEDDPYRRIRFEGVSVPPIQSFDQSNCVIGLGTFSKIVAPGLRIGWVAAAPDVIEKMAWFKSDGGSCPLTQRLILEYSRAGYIIPHVNDLIRIYASHRDTMLKALSEHLPEATASKPHGGYYLWVRLSEHVNTDKLLPVALRHGVEFLPASVFYATTGPANYLRLAYSYSAPDAIEEGMRRLRAAMAELTGQPRPGIASASQRMTRDWGPGNS